MAFLIHYTELLNETFTHLIPLYQNFQIAEWLTLVANLVYYAIKVCKVARLLKTFFTEHHAFAPSHIDHSDVSYFEQFLNKRFISGSS